MSANSDYDALLSTTLKHYEPKIKDQIFDDYPLWYWLKGRGRPLLDAVGDGAGVVGKAMDTVEGGERIVVPLLYGKNTTASSYSGYEALDTTPQAGISAAEFNWKQESVSIAMSGEEQFKNSGKAKMIDLFKVKTAQSIMSLREKLNEQAFADGTGNGGKDITGLAAIVAATPTTGTLGGINRATYSWWRNQYATTASFAASGIKDMGSMYNTCSRGKDHPDLILTDQTEYERYENACLPQLRFSDTKSVDAGFMNLRFKSAVMMFDNDATDGVIYFLNSRYLRLKVGKGKDFITTPFIRPENQDAMVAQILFYGNLVVHNCQRQGALTITAA